MERMISEGTRDTVQRMNSRLAELLAAAEGALRGECGFDASEIGSLQEVLAEMAPVIAQSAELRHTGPRMVELLDLYRSQLVRLQEAVEKVRIALLVHRTSVEASRTQMSAASQFCAAFQRTR
jgi:hypothetical protein